MVIHSIGKSRESLTHSSEAYKSLIRKYLDTMGYTQLTDSYVEGNLTDMVFINPNFSLNRKTYVESKATTISLANEDYSIEILKYLVDWLKINENSRFKLLVFTKKIAKKKEFEKIFGAQANTKNITAYVNKFKKKLDKNLKEQIDSADKKDIVSFFYQIDVFEANETELTNAINEKSRYSDLSLEGYAKNLLKETVRRKKPIRKKTNLLSNLIPLQPPKYYFSVKTKYKVKSKVYSKYNTKDVNIPPFLLNPKNQMLATFVDITKDKSLKEILTEEPKKIPFNEELSDQFMVQLLNQHLRRIFWKKGLRRIPDTNIFFFECFQKDGRYQIRTCKNKQGKEKEVSIPMYKKDNPKELNFIFHHAAEISAKKYWDKFYIEIIPRREYTENGVTPFDGSVKAAIDKTFRNPLFNRSSNKLSEIRFWAYFLFESKEYEQEPEYWFNGFKFDKLQMIEFDWRPETVPLGQSVLEEYYEEHVS